MLAWVQDYLTNRSQYTVLNGTSANKQGFDALEAIHHSAARIIYNLPWVTHEDVGKIAKWNLLSDMYKVKEAMLMYKIYYQ